MGTGIEQFLHDLLANLTGNFNSLIFVPLMLALSCIFALELMGRTSFTRKALRWLSASSSSDSVGEKYQAALDTRSQRLDMYADSALCGCATFKAVISAENSDKQTKCVLTEKFSHVGLVSALMLGASTSMFSFELGHVTETDKTVHGILWCIAVYAFTFSTLLSVMYIFAYKQCTDDYEARHFASTMGVVALRLPILLAGAGFFDFVAASTHFYVMNFRGGLAYDFSMCAAFCYSAIPMVLIAILKTHYSLGVTRRWQHRLESLAPLQYSDIDTLFRDYLKEDGDHLDVELNDFLDFVTKRKLIVDGEERGGRLRGLRRTYAEALVRSFRELERNFQKTRSEKTAKRIFDELENALTFTTALTGRNFQNSVMEVQDCMSEADTADLEQGRNYPSPAHSGSQAEVEANPESSDLDEHSSGIALTL